MGAFSIRTNGLVTIVAKNTKNILITLFFHLSVNFNPASDYSVKPTLPVCVPSTINMIERKKPWLHFTATGAFPPIMIDNFHFYFPSITAGNIHPSFRISQSVFASFSRAFFTVRNIEFILCQPTAFFTAFPPQWGNINVV